VPRSRKFELTNYVGAFLVRRFSRVRYAGDMETPPVEPETRLTREAAGLCADCVNARRVESSRGSVFLLCELSRSDPRFAKYPRLPVLSCSGYTPCGVANRGETNKASL
jgi:hypothetical protein